jgi:hypothetical protein
MLGAIGVPAIFEHVIGEGADGFEVFAAFVWISVFRTEADGEMAEK